LSGAVLVGADFGVEEEALVGEGLMDGGAGAARTALEALRQGVEQRRVGGIVIPVEVEIEDSARTTHRSRTRRAGRALVCRIDEAVAVAIAEARKLMHGQFPVRRVDVPLDQPPGQITQADHVPVGVLMNIKIALVFDPHHDELIDVLGAMNELLHHLIRAVSGFDNLLTIIQIDYRRIQLPGMRNHLPDPPSQSVKLRGLKGHAVVIGRADLNQSGRVSIARQRVRAPTLRSGGCLLSTTITAPLFPIAYLPPSGLWRSSVKLFDQEDHRP
jgi:hypothetical protein